MDFYNKPSPQEFLAHHGIKGQKWGVRRFQNHDGSYTPEGKKRYSDEMKSDSTVSRESTTKRNIAIGASIVGAVLVTYGAYRYSKFIKDKNVEIAVEKGKKLAESMRTSDMTSAQKYPDLFKVHPDGHYEKYVQEYADKARAQKFSEAFKNVKEATDKAKKAAAARKEVVDGAKQTIKELRTGRMRFGTVGSFNRLQQYHPDVLEELGVSVSGGQIYLKGKKFIKGE